jgi:hypothetical protein
LTAHAQAEILLLIKSKNCCFLIKMGKNELTKKALAARGLNFVEMVFVMCSRRM